MAKKQDTFLYRLKQGNKIKYIGTTKNPKRREQQHRAEGKEFGHMQIIPRPMTENGAKEKEVKLLDTYRRNHQGRNPKYNKDSDG